MTPPWPAPSSQRVPRSRFVALALGLIVNTALSVGALILWSTRPTPAAPDAPTAAQREAASKQLCDRYRLAANAAHAETSGGDVALSRIALTNGAAILQTAAANPALDAKHRDAALELATAYEDVAAMSTNRAPDDPELQKAVDDSNAKDGVIKGLCGG